MNKKIISPVAILIMLLLSCGRSSEEDLLEQALRFAGSNRPELEKVLVSYANEPLKLEAAKFLIRNIIKNLIFLKWMMNIYMEKMIFLQ